ncbi:GNAT family N-acetyltransferase [Histidinibacterium aquaticum]|uniref:GNAT family N-acetyltransferase n=1 Tax=Histidinibacterium aquaticum TaxID=2613962 RepID=A0A5J5GR75_9RHOB|nr:GNAT family N-acetyltransferase [Histidinibacterium aquaticum]
MRIRPARPSDLAELDALFARSYPRLLKADYPPSLLVTAVPMIARAQPRLLASGTYYVAELDGAIRGAGGWTPSDRPGRLGQRADVRHVVTCDSTLRRGIGRALLLHSFAEARAAGRRWMHCVSTLTAEPFYAALGFRRIGNTVVPLAPGIDFPAVEMWRPL